MKRSKPIYLLPPVLVWSLCYGILGGLFFKLLAVYELWSDANRLQVLTWKRYPARSHQRYAAARVIGRMNGQAWSTLPMAYNQTMQVHTKAPFPFLVIACNTLIALLYLPIALLSGIVKGPLFVFRSTWPVKNSKARTGNDPVSS